jgi:hypothetical protein
MSGRPGQRMTTAGLWARYDDKGTFSQDCLLYVFHLIIFYSSLIITCKFFLICGDSCN